MFTPKLVSLTQVSRFTTMYVVKWWHALETCVVWNKWNKCHHFTTYIWVKCDTCVNDTSFSVSTALLHLHDFAHPFVHSQMIIFAFLSHLNKDRDEDAEIHDKHRSNVHRTCCTKMAQINMLFQIFNKIPKSVSSMTDFDIKICRRYRLILIHFKDTCHTYEIETGITKHWISTTTSFLFKLLTLDFDWNCYSLLSCKFP